MKPLFFLLSLLLSLTVTAADGDPDLHTVILKHRLASDVAPKVKSLLPETAKVEAHENLLIINTNEATFQQVYPIIKQLDKAQTNLVITVAFSDHQLSGQSNTKQWSANSNQGQNKQFQVRGVSGQPVSISLQQLIPQQSTMFFVGVLNVGAGQQTKYINTQSGFQAVPNLLPDGQMKVQIHPTNSLKPSANGTIQSSSAVTTVTGSLDEWIQIGSSATNTEVQQQNVKTYSSNNYQQSQYLYLKVNAIK